MHRTKGDGGRDELRESVLLDDGVETGILRLEYDANRKIVQQTEPAKFVFYLRQGRVRLSVTSQEGREAIVAILGSGDFFGEECLAGHQLRIATATAMTQCALTRIEKKVMMGMLHEKPHLSELFLKHLLSRCIRSEADLADQLLNSSEKRLARTLLSLSQFSKRSRAKTIVPSISQADLAQMVGTTRSRVSHFMHKFKQRGFIDYGGGELTVKSGLRRLVLHDRYLP